MKHIVPIISGKGGVGKSTVAVNLAIALAATGAKVALIDGDFYGPSIPTLLGGGKVIPDHEERLIPPTKFGIKYISLGFFLANPDDPVIWRGPMFNKALAQLFNDVSWGEVDYGIVDMPPGTGDAQLSLSQLVQLSGAVVVSTPQEVAMADVRKAINMLSKVNVEVLGIVENMSGFVAPDGTLVDIFGAGGGELLAKQFSVPLLAQIPIDVAIRKGGDSGQPVACDPTSSSGKVFAALAARLIDILEQRQAEAAKQPALKIVN
jgi:ATP-binding protein involved in chromosome partitioning